MAQREDVQFSYRADRIRAWLYRPAVSGLAVVADQLAFLDTHLKSVGAKPGQTCAKRQTSWQFSSTLVST